MYGVEGYGIAGCERMENRLREIEAVDYSSRMSFKNGTAKACHVVCPMLLRWPASSSKERHCR